MPLYVSSSNDNLRLVPTSVQTGNPDIVRVHNGWTHRGEPVEVNAATYDTMQYVDRKLQQGRRELPVMYNQLLDARRDQGGTRYATVDMLRSHPDLKFHRSLRDVNGKAVRDPRMRYIRYAESVSKVKQAGCAEATAVMFAKLIEEAHGQKTYVVSAENVDHEFAGTGSDPVTDKQNFVSADLWCTFGTAHPLSDGIFKNVKIVADWPAGVVFKKSEHPPLERAQIARLIEHWVEPYSPIKPGTAPYERMVRNSAVHEPFSSSHPDRVYAAPERSPRRFNEFPADYVNSRKEVMEDLEKENSKLLDRRHF